MASPLWGFRPPLVFILARHSVYVIEGTLSLFFFLSPLSLSFSRQEPQGRTTSASTWHCFYALERPKDPLQGLGLGCPWLSRLSSTALGLVKGSMENVFYCAWLSDPGSEKLSSALFDLHVGQRAMAVTTATCFPADLKSLWIWFQTFLCFVIPFLSSSGQCIHYTLFTKLWFNHVAHSHSLSLLDWNPRFTFWFCIIFTHLLPDWYLDGEGGPDTQAVCFLEP